jgi:hypothetical protein
MREFNKGQFVDASDQGSLYLPMAQFFNGSGRNVKLLKHPAKQYTKMMTMSEYSTYKSPTISEIK